jgi:hypothetical protein
MTLKQVALGVCVAPLAISTAFTGVLFYDGKSVADMQVTLQQAFSCVQLLYNDDARLQAKLQSSVIPTWTTGLAYWPLVSVVMFRYIVLSASIATMTF